MSLADYMEDITRILERDASRWLGGGTAKAGSAKASIVRHAKVTECLRIDVEYSEPASYGVRFLPARAFAHIGAHDNQANEIENILRGAILVEAHFAKLNKMCDK